MIMLVLAIIGAGGIFTGTNPAYTPMELAHHFKVSDSVFLISEPEILDALLTAAKEVNIPEKNIFIFNHQGQTVPSGFRSWNHLLTFGEEDWVRFDDIDTVQKTTAMRLFSSGTTGLPKGVALTHYNFIAQQEIVNELHPRPYQVSQIIAIPVFHAAAAPTAHIATLRSGQSLYLMRRFDMETFLRTIEKYEITDLTVVPPIAIAIIMSPFTKTGPFLKKVKAAACGAAPLDKSVQEKFRALMADGAPMTQVWGMTETCCVATKFQYPEQDDTGSVGRLIASVEAKLIDDNGNNISAYGVRGEFCVRGPTVTPGYFKNDKANAESFDADGWFKTGDIAYCDRDTLKWYIVDRKKELIKVRGFQVAPPEIEAVLLGHPHIVDAAVIGVTIPGVDSEYPRAYVVRRVGEGDRLVGEDVQKYVLERLAKFKALTGGVKFVDAIPKNPSGKILKRTLREDAKKDIEARLSKAKM
ncbi:hypothetical protein MW887_005694 [Aspergillus wentii]|nr:hypothetical protein MW887_005694 [Aspergillus wentii]